MHRSPTSFSHSEFLLAQPCVSPAFPSIKHTFTACIAFRQIVPFKHDEQSKVPTGNVLAMIGEYPAAFKPAFDTFARMISLFVRHPDGEDTTRRALYYTSKRNSTGPQPFPTNCPWLNLLNRAEKRAQAWTRGAPIPGPHQPHQAVSVLPFLFVRHCYLHQCVSRMLYDMSCSFCFS